MKKSEICNRKEHQIKRSSEFLLPIHNPNNFCIYTEAVKSTKGNSCVEVKYISKTWNTKFKKSHNFKEQTAWKTNRKWHC